MASVVEKELLSLFESDPLREKRVTAFYLPVLDWCKKQIRSDRTVLIGVNGPQGSGKTTLCETMVIVSEVVGFRASTLSIDDFYLNHKDQLALARNSMENPYLQQRGYPGTHDVELGKRILQALAGFKTGGRLQCPQYDKSAFSGRGDRFSESHWKTIDGPLDLFFLEGWMLGYESNRSCSDPHLKVINSFLEIYASWNLLLESWIQLLPQKINDVVQWRVDSEQKRRQQGQATFSDEEVTSYIKKFLPAYDAYLPAFTEKIRRHPSSLVIEIGSNRLPISSRS